ncbi:MAG: tyrosine-type recombinase/integrase [Lachnospiraceae bacterium]
MEPRTVQRRYERLLRRCGIAPVNLHAMRHQLSSRWIAYGFDVKALSEILGHASTKTTLDIYVHSSHSQKRNYLNQVLTLQENSEGESREQTAAVPL